MSSLMSLKKKINFLVLDISQCTKISTRFKFYKRYRRPKTLFISRVFKISVGNVCNFPQKYLSLTYEIVYCISHNSQLLRPSYYDQQKIIFISYTEKWFIEGKYHRCLSCTAFMYKGHIN